MLERDRSDVPVLCLRFTLLLGVLPAEGGLPDLSADERVPLGSMAGERKDLTLVVVREALPVEDAVSADTLLA